MARAPLRQRVWVGEDLVDLRRTQRSARVQRAFDARAFTPREQGRIDAAADPAAVRWRLWSAKEAAFKAAYKGMAGLVFNASRFEVMADSEAQRAVVVHDAFRASVGWTSEPDRIHCVALVGDAESAIVRSRVLRDESFGDAPRRESEAARGLAHAMLSDHLTHAFQLIHEEPGKGPMSIRGVPADTAHWDLSVSHDGHFVSATICRTEHRALP